MARRVKIGGNTIIGAGHKDSSSYNDAYAHKCRVFEEELKAVKKELQDLVHIKSDSATREKRVLESNNIVRHRIDLYRHAIILHFADSIIFPFLLFTEITVTVLLYLIGADVGFLFIVVLITLLGLVRNENTFKRRVRDISHKTPTVDAEQN